MVLNWIKNVKKDIFIKKKDWPEVIKQRDVTVSHVRYVVGSEFGKQRTVHT